jgi:DNA-binding NarL/FixJ family response regulator
MIRVVVVEDHAVVRSGLLQLLRSVEQVEVVGSAAGGQDAVAIAAAKQPDVVLMDLEMPDIDGIEATRRIRAAHPQINGVLGSRAHPCRDRRRRGRLPAEGRRAARDRARARGGGARRVAAVAEGGAGAGRCARRA